MNDFTTTHAGMDGQEVTRYQMGGRAPQAPANIPRVSVGNIQGVTRYTVGQDSQEARNDAPGFTLQNGRIGQDVTRVTVGQQGIQEAGITRNTAADLAPTYGGILATLQNNAGFPTARVSPNATVELPGMGRTSVKVAANLGFLTLTADGRYVEAGGQGNAEGGLRQGSQEQQAANTQEQQQQQADEGPALFNTLSPSGETIEELYGELIQPFEQCTYESILATATAQLVQDGDLDGLIGALSDRYGADMASEFLASGNTDDDIAGEGVKERMTNRLRLGARAWQRQADHHVKAAGVEPSDFYEWARESNPGALKQAIQGQLFGRSLKGYTDLMNSYFDNVPPTLEALQRGGIPTKEQGGQTLVQLGGSWMSLKAAVKARLV